MYITKPKLTFFSPHTLLSLLVLYNIYSSIHPIKRYLFSLWDDLIFNTPSSTIAETVSTTNQYKLKKRQRNEEWFIRVLADWSFDKKPSNCSSLGNSFRCRLSFIVEKRETLSSIDFLRELYSFELASIL